MHIPSEFDSIHSFEPEELSKVFDRLLADPQFQQVLAYLYPNVPTDAIVQRLYAYKANVDFQKAFCYEFLQRLLARKAKSYDMDATVISDERSCTLISNHRDTVLDSGLLAKLLIDHNPPTTCEIAIGDNLLSLPWVKDLVWVDKAFIVERGVSFREMLVTSKRLSAYVHFAIGEKKENIWIVQREERAKDSDDRTAENILKMIAMGGEGNIIDRLQQLHLVPLAISYEYDPRDYLKAAKFQLKRDSPGWKKGSQDDIVNMQTGIMGYKGHIHYHCAPCIDDYLSTLDANMPKVDLYRMIAAHIDQEIHRNYRIYPNNYVAYDLLEGNNAALSHYTPQDKATFEQYLSNQLARIDIPNKDEAYLRKRMLTMYANPLRNHLAACRDSPSLP